jgi:hypothetical protein
MSKISKWILSESSLEALHSGIDQIYICALYKIQELKY